MSQQDSVPPVPMPPVPAIPLDGSLPDAKGRPAGKPKLDPFWQFGGIIILVNVVPNTIIGKLIIDHAAAANPGRGSDNSFIWIVIVVQLSLGLIIGTGLLCAQAWAKWCAWFFATLAAVLLAWGGQSAKPDDDFGAIGYYVMAAIILLGWLLLLDSAGKKAVNLVGALLVVIPCFLAFLRVIQLSYMPY